MKEMMDEKQGRFAYKRFEEQGQVRKDLRMAGDG
jgi:hypothetical protein